MIADAPLPQGMRPGGRYQDWRPAPPRYLVADVDGTLVGEDPHATEAVVAALSRAQEAGLRVGFATGRMLAAVRPLWERTRLPGPHVLHNGALVRAGGRTIASWPLARGQARQLLDLCQQHELYAELYAGDGYVVTDRRPQAAVHWEMLHQEPDGLARDLDLDAVEIAKATVAVFEGDPQPTVALLDEAGFATATATSPQAPGVTFINVTHPDASKGAALRAAADHVGVPLAAVVAVGDDWNDLPMLELVGTAIAMGQAPSEVHAAAHLIVPEVDADGVVHALDASIAWTDA